ncbi:hypothetical protein Pse7367_3269 [Thalassoporum mexicanum PCC 7367]|uniref:SWIM zinc finger family protein n=1 Tax=Thalassoporum mexicanum TaxID=3457544 RepID=UPI0002A00095|nr:SWIM zinc finger family protein [Pseudanabaena sp. PCC 7367]AFY71510.1 hypothetical protein Pse7367_3269 [Pseudanabaena sp. PCC 7367]
MASESNLINQIKQALAQYDDDSLAAIANRGMVRRARKDLQNGVVQGIIGERVESDSSDRGWVKLAVAEYEVEISALGAAKATCTCPAVEVCRHILAASIWLAEGAIANTAEQDSDRDASDTNSDDLADPAIGYPVGIQQDGKDGRPEQQSDRITATPAIDSGHVQEPEAKHSPSQEILAHEPAQLKKWVGKKDYEAAIALLASNPTVGITEGSPIVIKLPDFKLECRYFLGTGLEGMVCSRKSTHSNRYLVLAILAYQRQHGIDHHAIAAPDSTKGHDSAQAELLQQMLLLFTEAVGMGVCNLSNAVQQRFISQSVAATAANLPRLAKALRGIADEINLLATRSAQADEGRLFWELAQTNAIASATLELLAKNEVPPISLVGQHRSKYEEIGNLDLTGMGAYHWESKTGYAGVTVLFWEDQSKQWFCWSEVRPTFRGMGFSPWWRYKQSDVWEQSPETLSQNQLKLFSAKRNYQNRLSASSTSKVLLLGKAEPVKLDFGDRYFKRWINLRNYAATTVRTGLGEYDLLQGMVVVSPTEWGERNYDQVNQVFYWWLADEDGDLLPLRVMYRPTDEGRIRFLEALNPSQYYVWGIVAQITIAADGLALYPISLLCQPPPTISEIEPDQLAAAESKEQDTTPKTKQQKKPEPEARTVINLSFADRKYTKFSSSDDSSDRTNTTNTEQDAANESDAEGSEEIDIGLAPLDLRVSGLIDNLQRLAEHGGLIGDSMQREFKLAAQEFDRVGLSLFTHLLNQMNNPQISDRELCHLALKLRYLCQLWQENRLKLNLLA